MNESKLNKIETENRKILDEWAQSQRAYEKSLNNTSASGDGACFVIAPELPQKCFLDRAWDSAKSFVSGIIWIFIILSIIGLIFG